MISTLTLEQASTRSWDAVVVGAGPAGAMAAYLLARHKVSVLLVDRSAFPRWKVCGCCLNGRTLSLLDAAGLGEMTTRLGGVRLREIRLASSGRQATLNLPAGVALSREAFDAALVEAAIKAGADFLPETTARLGEVGERQRSVFLHQRDHHGTVAAALVLAADGLGGRFSRGEAGFEACFEKNSRIGAGVVIQHAPSYFQPGTIYMACGREGYVGLVRLEDGRLDVAAAFDPERVKEKGPGETAGTILHQAGLPEIPKLDEAGWRGTLPLTRRASRVAYDRVFVLGDAAGYVEPFTGEGISWALTSSALVEAIALRAIRRWDRALCRQWASSYRQLFRRHLACRAVAQSLRHPFVVACVVHALALAPSLGGPFLRPLNQPLNRQRRMFS